MVNAALERFGKIDLLINNAGPYIFERKKLADYTDDEWYDMLEGNLSSVFHLFKAVVPVMRRQRFGRIITYGFQGQTMRRAGCIVPLLERRKWGWLL